MKLWISPRVTDTAQTSTDTVPTVDAMDPTENSTSAGTPLATQNAPVQVIERVKALKGRRDSALVEAALGELKRAADSDTNLMPVLIDAARAYVTMGEICDVLRESWGVWRESPVF